MRLANHVFYAIDDFKSGRCDAALMNACIAIEKTAKKLYGMGGKSKYKKCLREYYWILDFMLGGGPDVGKTVWGNLIISDGHGKIIDRPDLADIIYHVFRCTDAHGEVIPDRYSLSSGSDGHCMWLVAKEELHMPDRIIWGLLAVVVFSRANRDVKTDTVHELRWGSERLGIGWTRFPIREWWGRENDFRAFAKERPQVKVDMLELDKLKHKDFFNAYG